MTNATSIASIRAGSAVALAATLVLAGTLLQPAPASAQCNPTCEQSCEANLKACNSSAQRSNKEALANCARIAKTGTANCGYQAVVAKTVQCLGQCGINLELCNLSAKQNVAACKATSKQNVVDCKASAKQGLQQAMTACQTQVAGCLSGCP